MLHHFLFILVFLSPFLGKTQVFEERDSIFQLAVNYAYAEDFENALIHFEHIVGSAPKDQEALFEAGMMCMHLHQYAKAEAYLGRYIELAPTEVDGYFLRGEARMKSAQNKGALNDFKKTLKLEGTNADAAYYCAIILHEMGRDKKALKYVNQAIENNHSEKKYVDLKQAITDTEVVVR